MREVRLHLDTSSRNIITPVNNKYRAHGKSSPGGEAEVQVLRGFVPFDGSAESGDSVPGPAHLLAAALAACVLKNVERFSGILSFQYTAATVEVTLQRENRPPRISQAVYTLDLHSEMPTHQARLLHKNIRKFGTVTNTLARSCELKGALWLVRADGQRLPVVDPAGQTGARVSGRARDPHSDSTDGTA